MASLIVSKSGRPRPIYGFDGLIVKKDVKELVESIRRSWTNEQRNKTRIFLLTGTHGDYWGNLLPEERFFDEDKGLEKQTVTAVHVGLDTPKNTWRRYFDQRLAVIILAWCYSSRWNDLHLYNN
jgi:hypothetical protein